jgi:hypothetical protein
LIKGVEKAESQKKRVAICILALQVWRQRKLTRTIKAARPSIMLEFRVRYAILSISVMKWDVIERGVEKKKKEGGFYSTFISTSPSVHTSLDVIIIIIIFFLNLEQCGKDSQRRVISDVNIG